MAFSSQGGPIFLPSFRCHMTNYIIERLKEASTWRGIVLVLTSFGLQISPDQSAAIVSLGLGVAGAIGALLPNKAGQ